MLLLSMYKALGSGPRAGVGGGSPKGKVNRSTTTLSHRGFMSQRSTEADTGTLHLGTPSMPKEKKFHSSILKFKVLRVIHIYGTGHGSFGRVFA